MLKFNKFRKRADRPHSARREETIQEAAKIQLPLRFLKMTKKMNKIELKKKRTENPHTPGPDAKSRPNRDPIGAGQIPAPATIF